MSQITPGSSMDFQQFCNLVDPSSELYPILKNIKPINKIDNPYELFIQLWKSNISISEELLNRRIISLYDNLNKKIVNFNNVDKLRFLIITEKIFNCPTIGKAWEIIPKINMDDIIDSVILKSYDRYQKLKYDFNTATVFIKKPKDYELQFLEEHNVYYGITPSIKPMFVEANFKNEVELRFNLTGTEFGKLFNFFMSSEDFYFDNLFSTTSIYFSKNRENIRCIKFHNGQYTQSKKEIYTIRVNNYPVKSVESEEKYISDVINSNIILTRKKNIFKFYTPRLRNIFSNFEISCSIVKSSDKKNTTYEFELERKFGNSQIWSYKSVDSVIHEVYKIINYDNLSILCLMYEKSNILNELKDHFKISRQPSDILNKVIPFEHSAILNFVKTKSYITYKIDGKRNLLVIKTGLGSFLISSDDSYIRIGPLLMFNTKNLIVLDCEVTIVDGKMLIFLFDILYDSDSEFIKNMPFSFRYETLFNIKRFIDSIPNLFYVNISSHIKGFFKIDRLNTVSNYISKIKNNEYFNLTQLQKNTKTQKTEKDMQQELQKEKKIIENIKIKCDGLIIQNDTPYDNVIYKYKLRYMNTIDFLYADNKICDLDGNEYKYLSQKDFMITTDYMIYTQKFKLTNFILECFYNPKIKKYIPINIRFDKQFPNSTKVVESTLNLIRNPFASKNFEGYELIAARKIINDYKKNLLHKLSTTLNIQNGSTDNILVDLGSGQGGDLEKWDKFFKVYAFEPDPVKIKEFESRQSKILHTNNIQLVKEYFSTSAPISIKIVNGKEVKTTLLDIHINFITIFFSLSSFMFSTPSFIEDFKNEMIKLTSKSYIPIYMLVQDGEYVKKHLIDKHKNALNVKLLTKNKISTTILGNKFINNIEEYLFDTKEFKKIMEINDLKGRSETLGVSDNSFYCEIFDLKGNIKFSSGYGLVEKDLKKNVTYEESNLSDVENDWINSTLVIKLYCREYYDTILHPKSGLNIGEDFGNTNIEVNTQNVKLLQMKAGRTDDTEAISKMLENQRLNKIQNLYNPKLSHKENERIYNRAQQDTQDIYNVEDEEYNDKDYTFYGEELPEEPEEIILDNIEFETTNHHLERNLEKYITRIDMSLCSEIDLTFEDLVKTIVDNIVILKNSVKLNNVSGDLNVTNKTYALMEYIMMFPNLFAKKCIGFDLNKFTFLLENYISPINWTYNVNDTSMKLEEVLWYPDEIKDYKPLSECQNMFITKFVNFNISKEYSELIIIVKELDYQLLACLSCYRQITIYFTKMNNYFIFHCSNPDKDALDEVFTRQNINYQLYILKNILNHILSIKKEFQSLDKILEENVIKDGVTSVIKINAVNKDFKQYLIEKPTECLSLPLNRKVAGIEWKNNSCYADCVLVGMGCSNLVVKYLNILKNKNDLFKILESLYMSIKIRSSDLIKTFNFKKGSYESATDFYNELSKKFNLVYGVGTTYDYVYTMLDDFTNLMKDKTVHNDIIVLKPKPGDRIPTKLLKMYNLQAYTVYLSGKEHYICRFKRFDQIYQYDGLDAEMKILKTWEFVGPNNKKAEIIDLLFYMKF
jgi:hypothetical protein